MGVSYVKIPSLLLGVCFSLGRIGGSSSGRDPGGGGGRRDGGGGRNGPLGGGPGGVCNGPCPGAHGFALAERPLCFAWKSSKVSTMAASGNCKLNARLKHGCCMSSNLICELRSLMWIGNIVIDAIIINLTDLSDDNLSCIVCT